MKTGVCGFLVAGMLGAFPVAGCNADTNSGSLDAGSGGTNGGASGTSVGTNGGSSTGCRTCGEQACSSEASTCDSTSGCGSVADCLFSCDSDANCQSSCVSGGEAAAVSAATALFACAWLACSSECSGQPTTAGTTESTANTAANSLATASTSTGSTDGANSTDTTSSTNGSGGGTNTTASGTTGVPTSGVAWLSFDGNWADIGVEPNASLNVSGVLYAYGDSCATINFDPDTRCVYGELCEPGEDFANWGIALGFDLHNTGEYGDPPETKFAWDANAVGATGLAWQVSGYAPGLQVWVTNMDPSWSGQCGEDDCAIDGPPDGTASAGVGSADQISFASMAKDDWGGAGTDYTFSAASILAMQFKLASVASGAISYDFCIDEIGIVL